MREQQEVIHTRRTENTKEHSVFHPASALVECVCVCVCVCLCADHSELVGQGPALKQQVNDVGVALLSRLVERSVPVLDTDTQTQSGKEREEILNLYEI